MTIPPLPEFDDSAELRTCLRDLVGLLGLPALWSSRQPQETVQFLAETLVEILALDACFVTTTFPNQEEPVAFLLADGKAVDSAGGAGWQSFVAQPITVHQVSPVTGETTPLGQLRVARFSLGYYGHTGQVTVGSPRDDFPKPTELILLRSAASLAASGLRTARLTYERERALRSKDEFLAMLGHEMRNPLAPIVTALELIKMKGAGTVSRELAVIERQVTHLSGIVEDLLDVTRISTGKVELKHEYVEVHSIVSAALETVHPLIQQRRHDLRCDIPVSGLLVNGDTRRLAQIISNLLINAAKYTEPEGEITVTASRHADKVSIQVKDNGIGIAPSLLPHVFDIFQQGTMAIDRSIGGLGIGLSVVKSLVAMHGGSVAAQSDGAGFGSSFTVTLPLVQDRKKEAAEITNQPDALVANSERILVVDDNRDAADVMGELLRAFGHEVRVQYAPLDALSLCEIFHPTVAIIDIGLPTMSGHELARLLRSRFTARPPRIIAITGYGQPHDRASSHDAGIELHLTKPVSMDLLLSHLHCPVTK